MPKTCCPAGPKKNASRTASIPYGEVSGDEASSSLSRGRVRGALGSALRGDISEALLKQHAEVEFHAELLLHLPQRLHAQQRVPSHFKKPIGTSDRPGW